MKKSKSNGAGNRASAFWKPSTIGDSITGTFGGLLEGEYKGQKTYSMRVGEHLVPIGAVLSSFVRGNVKIFSKPGAELSITYTGKAKSGRAGGRPTRLYSVAANGELLLQDSGFAPKEITVSDFVKKHPKPKPKK